MRHSYSVGRVTPTQPSQLPYTVGYGYTQRVRQSSLFLDVRLLVPCHVLPAFNRHLVDDAAYDRPVHRGMPPAASPATMHLVTRLQEHGDGLRVGTRLLDAAILRASPHRRELPRNNGDKPARQPRLHDTLPGHVFLRRHVRRTDDPARLLELATTT